MAHGLEVYNAAGALRLAVTDKITRLVYSAEVAATSSGAFNVSGITTTNAVVISQAINAPAAYSMPHEAWITSGQVHWAALPGPAPGSNDVRSASLIQVFRHA